MTAEILDLSASALELVLRLSAPTILLALAAGLIISLFQAATQIQEQTLPLVPKLIIVYGTLIATGAWMLRLLSEFALDVYSRIGEVAF